MLKFRELVIRKEKEKTSDRKFELTETVNFSSKTEQIQNKKQKKVSSLINQHFTWRDFPSDVAQLLEG